MNRCVTFASLYYRFCRYNLKMNKKLKLSTLTSHRCLRSHRDIKSSENLSGTSDYFGSNASSEKNVRPGSCLPSTKGKQDPIKKRGESKREESEESVTDVNNDILHEHPQKQTNKNRRKQIKITYDNTADNIKVRMEDSTIVKDETAKVESVKLEGTCGKETWSPLNWHTILTNIETMRQSRTAPVDSMGCHRCSDPNATAKISRYQSLIALMLSSQTKDQVTHAAMQRLIAYGCSPEVIAASSNDIVGKLIYPVGFWKKKVEYIKKASTILVEKYNGDIPNTLNGLCELPGVGPKMAHICMQIAWGQVSGIGVDTHVHRICNRLKWVRQPTKTPEETRNSLEEWLPKELWSNINHLLVGFGQEICLPRFPKCDKCLNQKICPFPRSENKRKEYC